MADVLLDNAGRNKIEVIKAIREATGLGLKEAKDIADRAPCTAASGLDIPTATALVGALRAAGGQARLATGAAAAGAAADAIWDDAVPAPVGAMTLVLLDAGNNKIAVIKEIRTLTGLGLKEAKDIADMPPQVVARGLAAAKAAAAREALQAAGARVELRPE